MLASKAVLTAIALPALFCAASAAAGDLNVPRFLTGRQVTAAAEPHPPEHWSNTENVGWKCDVPGLGWSSPVVWGDKVFLTTCINAGKSRAPRKGLYLEDVNANSYPPEKSEHLWKVYCIDLAGGGVLWQQTAHRGIPAKPHHIKNTLASETPATDGERLYVLFGSVGLFCYDLDGKLLWTHRIEPRETRYGWGTSMSPVVFGDRVYFADDNEEKSTLFALDKRTGRVIWQISRDEKTNYSTPFVWENPRRTELVISGINWVTSYDLEGKELWKIKGKSILAIPTPFEQFGLLYVTSGHVLWGENRIYAIRPARRATFRRSRANRRARRSPGTARSARITPRRSSSMTTCICSSIAVFWRASMPRPARSSTTKSGSRTAERSPAPPGATRASSSA